jgi:hypothetical protein
LLIVYPPSPSPEDTDRPSEGFAITWGLRVSGYDDETDGQWDSGFRRLSDVEYAIEDTVDGYRIETGASLTRVQARLSPIT